MLLSRTAFLVICALLHLAIAADASVAADATLRAADILRADILHGPDYRIEDGVTVKDHRYQFRIKTRWGNLTVDGLNMLGVRLQEIRAIKRADSLSRNPQFVGGLVESVSQTPRGVRTLLKNPLGAVLGVPKGMKRLASTQLHPADRRAGSVTRRRIAFDVGCDPETTNPILKPLIDNLATRKGLGKLVGKVGMSAAVPGLGLVPMTAEMQTTLLVKLPHEINRKMDRDLKAMGVGEKTRKTFLTSPYFTTGQRLIFMSQLRKLKHVENRAAVVAVASRAECEADALATNDELRMLIDIDRKQKIVRLEDAGVPTAVLAGGTCIAVYSADFLLATDDVSAMRADIRRRHPTTPALLMCSGRVSPAVRRLFSDMSISTTELR
ncbi:MAG: hypothetical protein HON53_15930 [Planctomycetaceae bacterium]|jgi:hypothetical protein|nr:hypothetical protein [Planctomycetaceae bacterium]MBT6157785.1 hypothetical protein [Planctomycetaceae bacterium]MBT6484533.1 hypothetical protein [Planctomycetaceae bacterium]MBT6492986.1 hypothetical protein [Planctomycetaceae bacterium]